MYIGIQEYKGMDCIHSYVQITFHSIKYNAFSSTTDHDQKQNISLH